MKKDIHPEYKTITAVCACGSTFEIGSVLPELKVEICSSCHPFFTSKSWLTLPVVLRNSADATLSTTRPKKKLRLNRPMPHRHRQRVRSNGYIAVDFTFYSLWVMFHAR